MIEVNQLTKNYGDRLAIKNLDFSVQKGEVVGFLGPNGAGKSTTMKIITGFLAPTSGEVKVGGYDVFENPIEVKKQIGYLPEMPPVYGDMIVEDYLKFVAQLKGCEKSKISSLVSSALEKTNLGDVSKRLIQNLSKGFKQRVGIAQAIVSNPEILILDEPTVGLDPIQVAEIRKLIQNLKGHHTVVLSSHILTEVQANCQRVIIINNGEIIAKDTISGLSNLMTGKRRLIVKTLKPLGNTEVLSSLGGVEACEQNGVDLHIDYDGKEESIAQISEAIVSQSVGLVALRTEDMALEDIFIGLTGQGGDQ